MGRFYATARGPVKQQPRRKERIVAYEVRWDRIASARDSIWPSGYRPAGQLKWNEPPGKRGMMWKWTWGTSCPEKRAQSSQISAPASLLVTLSFAAWCAGSGDSGSKAHSTGRVCWVASSTFSFTTR